MAGTSKGRLFSEKISPFLIRKMNDLRIALGEKSKAYQALMLQYVSMDIEKDTIPETNIKHYEAAVNKSIEDNTIRGVERLYRRCVVIETTMVCAAHCRYCLRANYDIFTLTDDELIASAKYIGSNLLRDDIREVLITGGDPLIIPRKLETLLDAIEEYAPNVQIARIATRLITQDPDRIDSDVYRLFRKRDSLKLELATQINHPVELFEESRDRIKRFDDLGIRIYAQNVLLKGINDEIETLIELYDTIRALNIEAHYLFHAIPLKGTHYLRTSVAKGIELARQLTATGYITGRSKPMFALMTEIGKISLYDGSVGMKNEKNEIIIRSEYSYSDRKKWNPSWSLPEKAVVRDDGRMSIWYLDGDDEGD